MGVSSSPEELARKLSKFAGDVRDTRIPINAAAFAVKTAWTAMYPGLVGHRVARGKVGVHYDVKGHINAVAIIRFTGPAHLYLNPTKPHLIEPRAKSRRGRRVNRKRALTIGGDVRASANHPGTRGKDPGARRAKAVAAEIAPRVYAKAGLTEPLRRNF
jgi:hypothetical protein